MIAVIACKIYDIIAIGQGRADRTVMVEAAAG